MASAPGVGGVPSVIGRQLREGPNLPEGLLHQQHVKRSSSGALDASQVVLPPKPIRTASAAPRCQETEFVVSPRAPLLDTELQDNALVWGDNQGGQLGAGRAQTLARPQVLRGRWAALSLGDSHAAALTASGELYCWGQNSQGALGLGQGAAATCTPCLVRLPPAVQIRAVSCGGDHSLAATSTGVVAWGSNRHSQCGLGADAPEVVWRPMPVPALCGVQVCQLAAGHAHSMCVTAQSQVYSWGLGASGQLGHGDRELRKEPTPVAALWALPVVLIAAGEAHSAAVTSNGQAWAWGSNSHGQLGIIGGDHASLEHHDTGRSTSMSGRRRMLGGAASAAGGAASRETGSRGGGGVRFAFLLAMMEMGIPRWQAQLALEETGNVGVEVATEWLFTSERSPLVNGSTDAGARSAGAAGPANDGDDVSVAEPRRLPLKGVRHLAVGAHHTVAVTDDGVYAWGGGAAGALGLGDFEDRDLPCRLEPLELLPLRSGSAAASGRPPPTAAAAGLPAGASAADGATASVVQVACGGAHTLLLTSDGVVYWCGTMPAPAEGEDAGGCALRKTCTPCRLDLYPGASGAAAGRRAQQAWGQPDGQPPPQPCPGGKRSAKVPWQPVPYSVATRGSSSAVLMCAPNELPQLLEPGTAPLLQRLLLSLECAEAARAACPDGPTLAAALKAVTAGLDMVFSTPAAINAAFGRPSSMGLDVTQLDRVLDRVLRLFLPRPGDEQHHQHPPGSAAASASELYRFFVVSALQRGATKLVEELWQHRKQLGTPERAQVLLAVLQTPLLGDERCAKVLLPRLVATVTGAPAATRQLLIRWWTECPGPLLESRLVAPLQQFITKELTETKKLTITIMSCIKLLALLHEAACVRARSLPPDAFYNSLISDKMDVHDHYTAWRTAQDVHRPVQPWLSAGDKPSSDSPFSFCSYPFLLNARAKSHLLHLDARFQMEQTVAYARMEQQLYSGSSTGSRRRAQEPGAVDARVLAKPVAAPRVLSAGGAAPGASASSAARASTTAAAVAAGASTSQQSQQQQQQQQASARDRQGRQGGSASSGRARPQGAGSNGSSESSSPTQAAAAAGGSSGSSSVGSSLRSLFMRLRRSRSSGVMRRSGSGDDTREDEDQQARRRAEGAGGSSGGTGGSGSTSDGSKRRVATLELPPPSDCNVPGHHCDMCILRVRRTHLVEDALSEIARQYRRDLYKPLRVHFIGEQGVDAGGVKKEFFQLLMERLLSPDYGLMTLDPESHTYWFNPASLEPDETYLLLGLVLGLAVYNRVLLTFPAPLLLYQKLLQAVSGAGGGSSGSGSSGTAAAAAPSQQQQQPQPELSCLRELEGWRPQLARGLRALLEYDGPDAVEDVFCLTFAADVDCFGHVQTVALKPGGEALAVTEESRAEYVALMAQWHLHTSVARQFDAFASGFRILCDGPVMSLFNAQELERLVCGNPQLDFHALRAATRYEGGYSAATPVVTWLWEFVLEQLSPEDQRALLKFFTGSDRAPIGGLGALRCVIQRHGPDSAKLPTSHTCFNTLLLPEYATRAKLARLLRLAINNSEGFGME